MARRPWAGNLRRRRRAVARNPRRRCSMVPLPHV